jgi:hypothetical protein
LKEVGKATGWRAGRYRHVKVSELALHREMQPRGDGLAGGQSCREVPAKNERRSRGQRETGGAEMTGGLSLISSLFLCIIYVPFLDAFFCQEGDDG